MLDRLLKIEEQLARAEALLLVVFVLLMLALATYNVFYRNVLVPIQVDLLTEDTATETAAGASDTTPEPSGDEPREEGEENSGDEESSGFGGGFDNGGEGAGGFGGGFGDEGNADPSDDSDDEADGFGGGFGDGGDSEQEPAAEEPLEPAEIDEAGGFGGGFGSDDGDDAAEGFGGGFDSAEDDATEGFGGGFDSADSDSSVSAAPTQEPADLEEKETPWLAELIDALKLEWIDVLLRQFVLIVGFLGAMLATRRRKHITIDALSKVTPEPVMRWMSVLTNTVSLVICAFLTAAGLDLVQISIEYPKELMSWAEEWHFQLVFPVGFGLLVLHFAIRVIESVYYALGWAEPTELAQDEGGAL